MLVDLDLPQQLSGCGVDGINVRRLIAEPGCQSSAVAFTQRDGASDSGLYFDMPENAATLRVEREQVSLGVSDINASICDDRLSAPRRRARKTERPFQFQIRNVARRHSGRIRRLKPHIGDSGAPAIPARTRYGTAKQIGRAHV